METPRAHVLKVWPEEYNEIAEGRKLFEFRKEAGEPGKGNETQTVSTVGKRGEV